MVLVSPVERPRLPYHAEVSREEFGMRVHGAGKRCATVLALLVLLAGCRHDIRRQTEGCLEVRSDDGRWQRAFKYLVYLPPGFDDPESAGVRWPLLLYFPGTLTYGDDVRWLAADDPPGEIESGRDFPMVVMSCLTPTWWERWHPRVTLALIDHAIATYGVDPDRVYLSGVSIGGLGAWDAAIAHPERIAAIVPIAAWGNPQGIERMIDVPVWGFHGALDFAVPAGRHELMIEKLRDAGGAPRWTVYPWGVHDVWTRTYARRDVYAWMLAQSLAKRRSALRLRGDGAPSPSDTTQDVGVDQRAKEDEGQERDVKGIEDRVED